MQVKSNAECSMGAFCNTLGLHKAIIGLENLFFVIFEWPLKTGFTVYVLSPENSVWCKYSNALNGNFIIEASTMNPDQTV